MEYDSAGKHREPTKHMIQVATAPTPGLVHIDLPSSELKKEVTQLMGEPTLLPEGSDWARQKSA